MNFKVLLAFLPFFAMSIVGESDHSIFDAFSEEVMFRERCKMHPSNPHCANVERYLTLKYKNGVANRFLESRDQEIWEEYKKQHNSRPKSVSLAGAVLGANRTNELSRMLVQERATKRALENEEMNDDFQASVLALIVESPDFRNQSELIQKEIIKQHQELVYVGLANAYNDQLAQD